MNSVCCCYRRDAFACTLVDLDVQSSFYYYSTHDLQRFARYGGRFDVGKCLRESGYQMAVMCRLLQLCYGADNRWRIDCRIKSDAMGIVRDLEDRVFTIRPTENIAAPLIDPAEVIDAIVSLLDKTHPDGTPKYNVGTAVLLCVHLGPMETFLRFAPTLTRDQWLLFLTIADEMRRRSITFSAAVLCPWLTCVTDGIVPSLRLRPLTDSQLFCGARIFGTHEKLMSFTFEEVLTSATFPPWVDMYRLCSSTDAELKVHAKRPNQGLHLRTMQPATIAREVLETTKQEERSRAIWKVYHRDFIEISIVLAQFDLPALICELVARRLFGQRRLKLVPFAQTYGVAHCAQQKRQSRKAATDLPKSLE